MNFLFGICYSLIAPLIVPFTAFSFGIAYIAMKYQMIYVYHSRCESGGTWWPKVFNLTVFSIVAFQLISFGSICFVGYETKSLLENKSAWFFMVLPFVSLAYWIYIMNRVAPESDYIKRDYSPIKSDTDPDQILSDRVFNPVVSKPLRKVWVRPEMQDYLESIYQPEYHDVVDFVRKTDAAHLEMVESLQRKRSSHLVSSIRKNVFQRQKFSDIVFRVSSGHLGVRYPPEEDELAFLNTP